MGCYTGYRADACVAAASAATDTSQPHQQQQVQQQEQATRALVVWYWLHALVAGRAAGV